MLADRYARLLKRPLSKLRRSLQMAMSMVVADVNTYIIFGKVYMMMMNKADIGPAA